MNHLSPFIIAAADPAGERTRSPFQTAFAALCALLAFVATPAQAKEEKSAAPWWDKEWTVRKTITVDAGGAGISEPIGAATVLVRLHDGTFQFPLAKDDGSDIRFVAEDGKTLLPYHVERYDALLNEAFVWVKVPDVKPGAQTTFTLYYGSASAKAVSVNDPKGSFDADTVLVYHFAERSTPPADATANGNNADKAGVPAEGALIGSGLRLAGTAPISIPATASLAWTEGGAMTWSAWIKPGAPQGNAVIFSRRDGGSALVVGADAGTPFIEVSGQRAAAGAPLAAGAWTHLAVVAEGARLTLFVNGEVAATLAAALPALSSPLLLGGDSEAGAIGFSGEMDELQISRVARPVGWVKLAAFGQGGAKAEKLLTTGADEQSGHGGKGSAALEHMMLFGDIAKNMMFDGWIAIGVCVVMIIFGWGVAVKKFNYLNSIQRGSDTFSQQWKHLSSDLTALDHDDEQSVQSLGGKAKGKTLRDMHRSPLYHLYHIGSEEIARRVGRGKDASRGLSARYIQAIRASLETGLVRESHRMNKGLIFLTISIAGGPYVGLLGTVVGVMITFAIIAKSGEVDVNSIAPGIASALLATVAGLVVAIPALFIYSYLSSRIKDLTGEMQVFIDEFISKMAEFYPTPADGPAPAMTTAPLPRLNAAPAAAHEPAPHELQPQLSH